MRSYFNKCNDCLTTDTKSMVLNLFTVDLCVQLLIYQSNGSLWKRHQNSTNYDSSVRSFFSELSAVFHGPVDKLTPRRRDVTRLSLCGLSPNALAKSPLIAGLFKSFVSELIERKLLANITSIANFKIGFSYVVLSNFCHQASDRILAVRRLSAVKRRPVCFREFLPVKSVKIKRG